MYHTVPPKWFCFLCKTTNSCFVSYHGFSNYPPKQKTETLNVVQFCLAYTSRNLEMSNDWKTLGETTSICRRSRKTSLKFANVLGCSYKLPYAQLNSLYLLNKHITSVHCPLSHTCFSSSSAHNRSLPLFYLWNASTTIAWGCHLFLGLAITSCHIRCNILQLKYSQ